MSHQELLLTQQRRRAMLPEDPLLPCPFATLPPSLEVSILRHLSFDGRARCATVCPEWRDVVAGLRTGRRVELTPGSGMAHRAAAVLALAVRDGGTLETLHMAGCVGYSYREVSALLAAHGGTLEELVFLPKCKKGRKSVSQAQVAAWLRAAPQLRTLHVDVSCTCSEAGAMLRNEPPFAPLRIRCLTLLYREDVPLNANWKNELTVLLRDAAPYHLSLEGLRISGLSGMWQAPFGPPAPGAGLGSPDALSIVVDAALALRLTTLTLSSCNFSALIVPDLARLLRDTTSLTDLQLMWTFHVLDEPSAAELGGALAANRTLKVLNLHGFNVWLPSATNSVILRALTAHPTLCTLQLARNYIGNQNGADEVRAVAAAALGALVLANAPALTHLDVSDCDLHDTGLRPLLAALPANEHLRVLKIDANKCSATFARNELLPAVRANTSLRVLCASDLEANVGMDVPSDGEDGDPEEWSLPLPSQAEVAQEAARLDALFRDGRALDIADEAVLLVRWRAQVAAQAEAGV